MAKEVNHKGCLPPGWIVRTSKQHPDLVYYYNTFTGDSTWSCPPLDPPRSEGNSFNSSNKRSLDLPSSAESKNDSNRDKKPCFSLHKAKFSCSEDNRDSKNVQISNSIDDKINGNETAEGNVATNAELKDLYRSNLDEVEDVEMLDVSQDLELIDELPENTCSSYYIVLDTNIFIHNLKQISVIQNHNMDDCGPPHIFIPWVVIQELDGLKKDAKLKSVALEAVKYINKMIKRKHPRFHGQSPKEVRDWALEYSRCNDDRILECCMSLADRIPIEKVILLTNDINLVNKSLICDISAHDIKSFWKKFKIPTVLKAAKKIMRRSADSTSTLSKLQHQSVVIKQESVDGESLQQSSQPKVDESESVVEIRIGNIMRKARLQLKKVLSAFMPDELDQSIGCIWETSKADVLNLSGQLHLLTEYWNSTFAHTFSEEDFLNFEYLWTKLNCSGGFSYETNECATILAIIENIFQIIKRKRPNINTPIESIRNNRLKCMQLQFSANMNTVSKNNSLASNSDIVLKVFDYNWIVINQLCGVVMDFYGVPHEFCYDRPSLIPSEAEFVRLMCNLYPGVQQLKRFMCKFFEEKNINSPPGPKFYKKFADAVKNFVPSLQVDIQPLDASQFDAKKLEIFFNEPENQEKIAVGYKQLELFFSKLQEVLPFMVSARKET